MTLLGSSPVAATPLSSRWVTVYLVQGTSVIAPHVPAITSTFGLFQFTPSSGEADSITDYTDLRLRFVSS